MGRQLHESILRQNCQRIVFTQPGPEAEVGEAALGDSRITLERPILRARPPCAPGLLGFYRFASLPTRSLQTSAWHRRPYEAMFWPPPVGHCRRALWLTVLARRALQQGPTFAVCELSVKDSRPGRFPCSRIDAAAPLLVWSTRRICR